MKDLMNVHNFIEENAGARGPFGNMFHFEMMFLGFLFMELISTPPRFLLRRR